LNDANSGPRILAGEEIDVEEARETFEDIATAAKRASDVIEHIRQLLAKHSTEHQPLDVNELLHESLDLVRSNLAERGIQLVVDSKPILLPVLGDRVQLQQVVINLVSNAAHAIEGARSEPNIITVQAAHRDNDVTVSVRDNGVGFGQDQNLDRLFDAFYTTRANGIGMGLAITKTIVESHGGRIWAERNADRGATFTFTIPLVSGAENV
jgi:two-component system sensor kinase FixL